MPTDLRKEQVKTYSRVKYHEAPRACTAWMRSPKRGPVRRCKNVAHWRFRGLVNARTLVWGGIDNGDFCWSHLMHQGLFADPDEARAFEKWWTRKYGTDSTSAIVDV